ncbi:MAG: beta-propeller fold lactonase family protein [Opitutaceae bacterium]
MFNRSRFKTAFALLSLVILPIASWADNAPGAVYTQSNSTAGNRVIVFARDGQGALEQTASVPTEGTGTGGGLGSQGAVAMTENGRYLLAVNAGSNDISVFAVRNGDLVFTAKESSGGVRPISLTIDHNLVYVLNAGGGVGAQDSIVGFYLTKDGRLLPFPNSTRALSAANTGPAQISFAPSGDHLVVTEKGTNLVDTFVVDENGAAGAVQVTASSGPTPFGFAFTPSGTLVVSEAVGGAPGASLLSSYRVTSGDQLTPVTASLPTAQTAACWVAVARNGKFAYAANTGSNTVTGVRVESSGGLSLLQADGISATTGATPTDVAVSNNDRFLSVLNAGSRSISQYRIESDGTLIPLGSFGALPAGSVGLVAR